jgi:hypothetical protein
MRQLILMLVLGPVLSAQNVDDILQRYFAAGEANAEKASQYTYVSEETRFEYDKAGVAKQTSQETYDIIFVEGDTYKKLVLRNGQPLSAKDAAKEEKKLQDVAKERRKQRRSGLFSRTVTFSSSDDRSTTLFERHLLDEEVIDGRKAWVIELTPRAGQKPANAHEKDALASRRKLWVDQLENALLRWEAVIVGDNVDLEPGTKFIIDFAKINEEAWLATSMVVDLRFQVMKFIRRRERVETKNSKFQKFDVQSTITVDEVR